MIIFKKKLQIILMVFVLSNVLLASIKQSFDGYYGFYFEGKKNEKKERVKLSTLSDYFYSTKPILIFRSYTGFETGYGFFGPNVSSDFVTLFKIYDQNGVHVKTIDHIHFDSKESTIRFTALDNLIINKFKKKDDVQLNQFIDILMKQISKHVSKGYPENYKVETELYLFDYPTIAEYNNGETEKIILINKYSL